MLQLQVNYKYCIKFFYTKVRSKFHVSPQHILLVPLGKANLSKIKFLNNLVFTYYLCIHRFFFFFFFFDGAGILKAHSHLMPIFVV